MSVEVSILSSDGDPLLPSVLKSTLVVGFSLGAVLPVARRNFTSQSVFQADLRHNSCHKKSVEILEFLAGPFCRCVAHQRRPISYVAFVCGLARNRPTSFLSSVRRSRLP